MNIHFNVTGADRKALVAAISEATGATSKYMGAPGFAYSVGGYTVTKDGTLECGDAQTREVSALLESLAESGFSPVETSDLCGVSGAETVTSQAADDVLAIELPAEGWSDTVAENLKRLAAGKAPLIRTALGENNAEGAAELPIVFEDGRVCFPWFRPGMDADAVDAWSRFAGALCATAKKQKRVVMTEKPYDGSEKYAMRCFLLKLGFIGEEYKPARKILLANLSGNGSHKNPKEEAAVAPPADGQDADYELAEALADAELIHNVNASFEYGNADEGERLVRGGLCCVPPSDGNYASYLCRATDAQLCEAVANMEASPEGHKGRIAACRRELAKREAAAS